MTPPRISALLESLVPKRFPRESPVMQIKNVTMAMIREQTRAISQSYSEMVNPTDRASMEGGCNALNEKGFGTNSWNFIILIGSPDTIDQHGATNIAKKD